MTNTAISFRHEAGNADLSTVRDIVLSTGRFNDAEVRVAVELVEDRIAKGRLSEYRFIFALSEGSVLGYTCFGLIPGTAQRFEVYWVAVHAAFQRLGVGRALLGETERLAREAGGKRVYIETCSREEYQASRNFYLALGYQKAAQVDGYYSEHDGLVIYMKELVPALAAQPSFATAAAGRTARAIA